ncbi:MAG: M24 family metallopeptidase C-terminal domain-containing protein, partial [Bacteroidales bacterium]
FLGFDTLTLFPIDTKGIDFSLLSKEEIDWLNNYHQDVYAKLSPNLTEDEDRWLNEKTKPVQA